MGDDEEVEAAGLYTGLCSTSTAQSLGSVQLLLKKKSTAVERCSTLSCAVEERFVHLPYKKTIIDSIRSRCAQYPVHSPSGSSA